MNGPRGLLHLEILNGQSKLSNSPPSPYDPICRLHASMPKDLLGQNDIRVALEVQFEHFRHRLLDNQLEPYNGA